MKHLRLHHLFVYGGAIAGAAAALLLDTEPRLLGWAFGIGAGLAGGAFLAAIFTGEPLAGGGRRGRRGRATRPAWFDAPSETPRDRPSNGAH